MAAVSLVRSLLPALLGAGLLVLLAGCGEVSAPRMMEARGDTCVEPVEVMRRDHMKLLKHERNQALRLGARTERYSLNGCIECHVSPTASREDPSSHFCLNCHAFNAVRFDCFQCHADKPMPDSGRVHALNPNGAQHALTVASGEELANDAQRLVALEIKAQ
ncbi:MAG: hypothetical protein PHQ14_05225 [Chromatiales bacterium]|jgi:hypothetical protein|nr:hypothetical protein [Chromatiales bacterium]MDX9766201.1 hypothetical protein [Ectothiorhodospiraceae bacterium]